MIENKHPVIRLAFLCARAVFRSIPMPEEMRDRIRGLVIRLFDQWLAEVAEPVHVEPGNNSRQLRLRADETAIGYVPSKPSMLSSPLPARLVAFYRIGFAQPSSISASGAFWKHIAGALPQFEGHIQPRLPGELGFYDPSNPDFLRRQAQLAKQYGIEAFCFLIGDHSQSSETAMFLQKWKEDEDIALSFCLCLEMAPDSSNNAETSFDAGNTHDMAASAVPQLESIAEHLKHHRYLHIGDKPVLLVRNIQQQSSRTSTQQWRQWCQDNAIGAIHLVAVHSGTAFEPLQYGFDASVALPWSVLDSTRTIKDKQYLINPDFSGHINDWRTLASNAVSAPLPSFPSHPAICTGLDTEPLHPGKGCVLLHAAPRRYRDWLVDIVHRQLSGVSAEQRLVFIDAWNDWLHGAILEPDARLGYAWLEATGQALNPQQPRRKTPRPCAVIHAWYPDIFEEILYTLKDSGLEWRIVVTTTNERATAIKDVAERSGLTVEITCWPNQGRDILPFLQVANRLLDEGEDIVLKLHTKRSPHLENGEQWRREMISNIAGESRARRIAAAFQHDPRLGLVSPEGHVLNLIGNMFANQRNVLGLLRRSGYTDEIKPDDTFIAGSMFWLRLEAIRPLLDAHLSPSLFETEAGQVDGTLAHAVERCINLLAVQSGFRHADAASVVGEPPRSSGMTLQTHRHN